MKSEIFLPLVFTLTVAVADGEVRDPNCKVGFFLDSGSCKPCSVCPPNQIVRRPCYDDHDVFCGHFTEFNEFNQHQELTLLLSNTTAGDRNNHGQQSSRSSELGWRKLSMALVIALSLGFGLLTAGIIAFCCWKKRQATNKEVTTVVYQRDPLTNDVLVNPPAPTFHMDQPNTSALEESTFVPQPSTSGERIRSPKKKNDYVKLFRPKDKSGGEIDLDLEEKMAGFVSTDMQDDMSAVDIVI